jgi:phage replication initiation protein
MSLAPSDLRHALRQVDAVTGKSARKSLIFGFTPVEPCKSSGASVGPETNRGQKSMEPGYACGIDWLSVTFSLARLEECSATNLDYLAQFLLGGECGIKVMRPSGKRLNFYDNSCVMLDREGTLVGHVCFGGNGDRMMFELTGAGCRWVKSWAHVRLQLEILCARVTRCDVALDDFAGKLFDVRKLAEQAKAGAFKGAGRPPKSRFLDDHGNGTGCTLYVGKKGHKELCVYEKGKQLKDETSSWVRAEQRFYGKHYSENEQADGGVLGGLPYDILTAPLRYLRGAHDLLYTMTQSIRLDDLADKLHVVKAKVEATANAAVKWLREQCGPTLNLLFQALGDDAPAFLRASVTRDVLPSRFKALGAAHQLSDLVRLQLCHVST